MALIRRFHKNMDSKRSEEMESATDILARMETAFAKQVQTPPELKSLVESELIRPQDIAYVHSIFMQCFLPLRHNPKNRQFWQTDCGNVSMHIRAGVLAKPDSPGTFKMCDTPAGPKGRIVATYIDDYAWRNKTPEIDMGGNLHDAMQQMGVKVGGKNSKELQREVENFAAAEINIGFWMPGQTRQNIAKVSQSLTFWIEKNPDQRTLWQPTMTLSQEYYGSIANSPHIAPVYWPAVVGLQAQPACDGPSSIPDLPTSQRPETPGNSSHQGATCHVRPRHQRNAPLLAPVSSRPSRGAQMVSHSPHKAVEGWQRDHTLRFSGPHSIQEGSPAQLNVHPC